MASVVFILGAGASQEAGAPLMADFLDVADELWKSGKTGDKGGHFEKVFKTIGALQAVHSKAQLDLTNIESIFATLELAKILNKIPGSEPSNLDSIISSLKELIVVTLETTIQFPLRARRVLPPKTYDSFIDLLAYLREEAQPRHSVSIITFNYDMAMDYALYLHSLGPDYCLDSSTRGEIPLLKLHGSLNWAICQKCKSVVPWALPQYFDKFPWESLDENRDVTFQIGSQLKYFEHCNVKVAPEPVLVPPTWNKADYQHALSHVWSRASKELEDAENIFIIGYSLPPTDAFFRLLYALGTVSEKTLKRIWVYNPSKELEERFSNLLGPGAKSRFSYIAEPFSKAVNHIKAQFHT